MDRAQNETDVTPAPAAQGRLGTFAGVFTPSILTILGIILFMRLGYVVGAAGLGQMLLILALANLISVLTSLSLSAVATNLHVKRGGDYYLISRTLGQEFGGAIGIVLFLAQSVSVGFYCIGFAEVLGRMLPGDYSGYLHLIAGGAATILFVFAWLGADWATRFQYVVMTVLVLALVSFFIGGAQTFDTQRLLANWQADGQTGGFWFLFALFFPAVTGFTQGVSMSGDLQDPGRSLPRGTLWAVGLSILIYLAAALVFAGALPQQVLVGDYEAMQKVALFPSLIFAGVVAATLSSAMASFLGAPRILQSLAQDRLFRMLMPFAEGAGPQHNPRRAVLLTAGVALLTISIGQLDLIAPVVSMFFLISYGLINYATFFESSAASPSFRPSFRFFHPHLSLLGAIACFTVMLAIDLRAGVAALVILSAIYLFLRRTVPQARWADGRRSYYLQRIRANLLDVANEPEHPRDWRPNILLFSDDSHRRRTLLRLASALEGDSGFVTAVRLIQGRNLKAIRECADVEEALRADIRRAGVEAFPLALAVDDLDEGVHTLVQSFGIGPLKANLMLLNWLEHRGFDNPRAEQRFGRHLRTAYRLGCSLLVLDGEEDEWLRLQQTKPAQRRIDVWWWGGATGHLMLLLAHLMTRDADWRGAKIRVLTLAGDGSAGEALDQLQAVLGDARIAAEPQVVEGEGSELLVRHSRDASLVFMPLRLARNQPLDPFGNPLNEVLGPLPPTVMTMAARDIELDAEPEEGEAAEKVRILDAVADNRRVVELTERDLEDAQKELDALSGAEEEINEDFEHLQARVEHSRRRVLKARMRLEEAEQQAQRLGLLNEEEDAKDSPAPDIDDLQEKE